MTLKLLKSLLTNKATRQLSLKALKAQNYKIILQVNFDNSILTVYENGLASYEVGCDEDSYGTVFNINKLKWKYTFADGTSFTVPESTYENMDAAEILRFIGEERLQHNADSREEYRAKAILDNAERGVVYPNERTPDFSNDLVDYFDQLAIYNICEARKIDAEQKSDEVRYLLKEALESLTEKQAEVIRCTIYEQRAQVDSANELKTSRSNIQSHKRLALKKMRKKFKNYKYLPSIR